MGMHMRILPALFVLLLLAGPVAAQTADPCVTTTATSDTVQSNRPFTVTWKLPAQVPVSATDPTLVPAKYDGFLLALDGATGTARKEALPLPVPKTCPDGKLGFSWLYPTGVPKGGHTMLVSAYMLDPTGVRLEGLPTTRPFVAVDPVPTMAPPAPTDVRIWK